jgi:cell division protein FtsB
VKKDHSKTLARRRHLPNQRLIRAKRIGQLLLLFVAAVMAVDALVGERGLLAMWRARQQYESLSIEVTNQRAENARLSEIARRLRDDPAAIEELARRELGLIRPGEKVFIVKDLAAGHRTTPSDH